VKEEKDANHLRRFQQPKWVDHNHNGEMDPYEDPRLPTEERIADLLPRLSLEEKVEYLAIDWTAGAPPAEVPVPPDTEREEGCTQFPVSIAKAATWNPALVREMEIAHWKEDMARRNKYLPEGKEKWYYFGGGHGNLARDPRWGRTDHLSRGEDPYLTSKLGSLPFAGVYNEEIRRLDGSVSLSDQRLLRDYYFAPLRYAFDHGNPPDILMSAYVALNGIPCTANGHLLTDIVRNEYGFDGAIVEDYNAIRYIHTKHRYASSLEEAVAMALKAGCDNCGCGGDAYLVGTLPALEQGLITMEDIDRAVTRVLRIGFRQGRFDHPEVRRLVRVRFEAFDTETSRAIPYSVFHCEDHVMLALQAAKESMVLLKNEGNLLPLDRSKVRRILLSGCADSCQFGGYKLYSREAISTDVSPLGGLEKRLAGSGVEVVFTPSYREALKEAQNSDVAIFFATVIDGEERDRLDLGLPAEQEVQISALAATGTPTIVVLMTGSCVTMQKWIDNTPSILLAWYPGEQGGHAIADILLGDYNPSGKLPLTFYKSVDQLPEYDDYDIRKAGTTYLYMIDEPQFPFGHGLSYTHFEYSNLVVEPEESPGEDITVRFDVTNSGARQGAEVAQVYVHDRERSTGDQPIKQLVGFRRLLLQPGETIAVELAIEMSDLAFHDRLLNRIVERGNFELMVGGSSQDIRLRSTFRVTESIIYPTRSKVPMRTSPSGPQLDSSVLERPPMERNE
jgi:beta-glucosidase